MITLLLVNNLKFPNVLYLKNQLSLELKGIRLCWQVWWIDPNQLRWTFEQQGFLQNKKILSSLKIHHLKNPKTNRQKLEMISEKNHQWNSSPGNLLTPWRKNRLSNIIFHKSKRVCINKTTFIQNKNKCIHTHFANILLFSVDISYVEGFLERPHCWWQVCPPAL